MSDVTIAEFSEDLRRAWLKKNDWLDADRVVDRMLKTMPYTPTVSSRFTHGRLLGRKDEMLKLVFERRIGRYSVKVMMTLLADGSYSGSLECRLERRKPELVILTQSYLFAASKPMSLLPETVNKISHQMIADAFSEFGISTPGAELLSRGLTKPSGKFRVLITEMDTNPGPDVVNQSDVEESGRFLLDEGLAVARRLFDDSTKDCPRHARIAALSNIGTPRVLRDEE